MKGGWCQNRNEKKNNFIRDKTNSELKAISDSCPKISKIDGRGR